MCLLDLFQGVIEAVEIAYTFLGIVVGRHIPLREGEKGIFFEAEKITCE